MSAIVFDLDGTLIDSAPDLRAAANAMLADERLEPLDLVTITSFIGNGLPHLVRRVMEFRGLDMTRHDALTDTVLNHYAAAKGAYTTLYPNVKQVLTGLRADGHVLGLCTNKPIAPTRDVLEQLDLAGLFETVIAGDSLPQRKPHPAPLLAAFKALGSSGLYVGDSEVDAETAQRGEVPFALFTEGYRKTPVSGMAHRWSFSDFAALPTIVASLVNPSA